MTTVMQLAHMNRLRAQAKNSLQGSAGVLAKRIDEIKGLPLPERLLALLEALSVAYDGYPGSQTLPTWQVKKFFPDVTTTKARSVLKQLEAQGKVCRSERSTPINSIWMLSSKVECSTQLG